MDDYNFEDLEKMMQQKEGKTQPSSRRNDNRDRQDDRRDRDRDRDREKDNKDKDRDREHRHDKEKVRKESRGRDGSSHRERKKKQKRPKRSQQGRERSGSASRSRDRRHKKHSRDKSDKSSSQRREQRQRKDRPEKADRPKPQLEKDPYYRERKEIERVRQTDSRKAQEMERQLQKRIIIDKKQKEVEIMTEKFKEAKRQLEQARRQDLTVLVHSLPLKAKEKDIWSFFVKQGCGKIADIRIIKDPKSNKSKGVAYVQFYTPQSIQKALLQSDKPFECNGRSFMGLKVMHSQAEKNRAAAAARQMRMKRQADPFENHPQNLRRSMKVVVGGLVDALADIQQERLKELFGQFGQIEHVEINRDPLTGRCKGFAFIQYTHVQDAKAAVKEMNGIRIKGQQIKVTTVSVTQRGQVDQSDEYLHSEASRNQLRSQLSQSSTGGSNLSRPPIATISTQYILLTNMFTMQGKNPAFFQELKKDVLEMCSKFGTIEKSFVEKNNQGNIWLKFSDTASASKAQQNLSTQFFDGKKVFCYSVMENTYQRYVGGS